MAFKKCYIYIYVYILLATSANSVFYLPTQHFLSATSTFSVIGLTVGTILKTIFENQGLTQDLNQFMDQIVNRPKMQGPKVHFSQKKKSRDREQITINQKEFYFCWENVNKFEYCHLQRTELSNYENINIQYSQGNSHSHKNDV